MESARYDKVSDQPIQVFCACIEGIGFSQFEADVKDDIILRKGYKALFSVL